MSIVVKLSVVQLTSDDKDLWNTFVRANSNAQVYHLWEWGDVLCRTYRYERYYLAVKCEGDIVGALPFLLIRSRIFPDKLVSLPFCGYGGPLLANSLDTSTVKRALRVLLKNLKSVTRVLNVDYIELKPPPVFSSSVLSAFGFATSQRYLTFRIDLRKGESKLWQNLKRDVKRRVTQAMKTGIEIKSVGADDLREYYDIYLSSMKRHGSPPHSYELFMNIFEAFKPEGLLQMLLAVHEGKPIAGDMFFCFNDKMSTWSGVVYPQFRDLYPTHLLFWHMIRWGSERGFKTFDLGRTRSETEGIYYFKSRWGGNEMDLHDYFLMKKESEIPDPLQRRYTYLSKIWSRLPSALSRWVGPKIMSEIGR